MAREVGLDARLTRAPTAQTKRIDTTSAHRSTEVEMHQRRRRLSLLIGMTVLAIAAVFPAGVAAAQVTPAQGPHVWSGQTCAGDNVSLSYHVGRRGRIVIDAVTGGTVRVVRSWFRTMIRFRGTTTRVFIWTHFRHGTLHLHVDSTNGRCPTPPDGDPVLPPPPPVDPGNDSPPG
jgi:hypothetical protein